jgi:hypothetical protein
VNLIARPVPANAAEKQPKQLRSAILPTSTACDVSAVAITWENTAWNLAYMKVGATQFVKA